MYVFLRFEVLQGGIEDAMSEVVNANHSRDESLASDGIPNDCHDEEEALDVMTKVFEMEFWVVADRREGGDDGKSEEFHDDAFGTPIKPEEEVREISEYVVAPARHRDIFNDPDKHSDEGDEERPKGIAEQSPRVFAEPEPFQFFRRVDDVRPNNVVDHPFCAVGLAQEKETQGATDEADDQEKNQKDHDADDESAAIRLVR